MRVLREAGQEDGLLGTCVLMRIEIPAPVREILSRLNENGCEGYIVGGCVRDMLLGREPGDWDITTSALPHEVKAIFRRTIDTGIEHGTVTVMMNRQGYEVTTYRVDGDYSDGRHPDSVSFTRSLAEDLKRRDFTINAMAYNSQAGLVDLFGGREDLEAGIIRCVGEPMDRFGEDALRILRAIRFSAQLGFQIEGRTMEAVRAVAPNLEKVSRERVQTELTKLLLSPHPERMALVYETGVSLYVGEDFHKACAGKPLPFMTDKVPAEKALRWAAFLREAGPEQAARILKGLKLDNDTIYRVRTLAEWLPKPLVPDKPALRRLMSRLDAGLYGDLLSLKGILRPGSGESEEELREISRLSKEIRANGDCLSLKELAVTGRDVMEAGIGPGKAVGETLSRLLDMVLEDPSRNRRDYLLQHLK